MIIVIHLHLTINPILSVYRLHTFMTKCALASNIIQHLLPWIQTDYMYYFRITFKGGTLCSITHDKKCKAIHVATGTLNTNIKNLNRMIVHTRPIYKKIFVAHPSTDDGIYDITSNSLLSIKTRIVFIFTVLNIIVPLQMIIWTLLEQSDLITHWPTAIVFANATCHFINTERSHVAITNRLNMRKDILKKWILT